jgi:hypothetical protein
MFEKWKISSWRESPHGLATAQLPASSRWQVQYRWPQTEHKPLDKSEAGCHRVRGKGKGVAARVVPRGELEARERELLLMPRTFLTPQHAANTAASAMTPKQGAAFLALYNCESAEPGDALGITRTNSFLVPAIPGHSVLYSAVFEPFSSITSLVVSLFLPC